MSSDAGERRLWLLKNPAGAEDDSESRTYGLLDEPGTTMRLRYDAVPLSGAKPSWANEDAFRETHAVAPSGAEAARLLSTNLSPFLLVVELAVPEAGRIDEWNSWYASTHMPSVVEQIDGVEAGRRFLRSSGDNATADEYLVLYEFSTQDLLRSWRDASSVEQARDTYVARWGVRNQRYAFEELGE